MEEREEKSYPCPHLNLCSTNNSQHHLASTTNALEFFNIDFYNFVLIRHLYYKLLKRNGLALYF